MIEGAERGLREKRRTLAADPSRDGAALFVRVTLREGIPRKGERNGTKERKRKKERKKKKRESSR